MDWSNSRRPFLRQACLRQQPAVVRSRRCCAEGNNSGGRTSAKPASKETRKRQCVRSVAVPRGINAGVLIGRGYGNLKWVAQRTGVRSISYDKARRRLVIRGETADCVEAAEVIRTQLDVYVQNQVGLDPHAQFSVALYGERLLEQAGETEAAEEAGEGPKLVLMDAPPVSVSASEVVDIPLMCMAGAGAWNEEERGPLHAEHVRMPLRRRPRCASPRLKPWWNQAVSRQEVDFFRLPVKRSMPEVLQLVTGACVGMVSGQMRCRRRREASFSHIGITVSFGKSLLGNVAVKPDHWRRSHSSAGGAKAACSSGGSTDDDDTSEDEAEPEAGEDAELGSLPRLRSARGAGGSGNGGGGGGKGLVHLGKGSVLTPKLLDLLYEGGGQAQSAGLPVVARRVFSHGISRETFLGLCERCSPHAAEAEEDRPRLVIRDVGSVFVASVMLKHNRLNFKGRLLLQRNESDRWTMVEGLTAGGTQIMMNVFNPPELPDIRLRLHAHYGETCFHPAAAVAVQEVAEMVQTELDQLQTGEQPWERLMELQSEESDWYIDKIRVQEKTRYRANVPVGDAAQRGAVRTGRDAWRTLEKAHRREWGFELPGQSKPHEHEQGPGSGQESECSCSGEAAHQRDAVETEAAGSDAGEGLVELDLIFSEVQDIGRASKHWELEAHSPELDRLLEKYTGCKPPQDRIIVLQRTGAEHAPSLAPPDIERELDPLPPDLVGQVLHRIGAAVSAVTELVEAMGEDR